MNKVAKICAIWAVFLILPSTAWADCYADYKAKKDSPLRLHYGVVHLTDIDCLNPSEVATAVKNRIATDGWKLLNILTVFDKNELDDRRESAGDFFLRY